MELNELANRVSRSAVAVIDAVTTRGGFKGEELSSIGTLRDQCIQLIQMCEEASEAEAAESEDQFTTSKDCCIMQSLYYGVFE